MCELFGLSSQKKINIEENLKEFFSHSVEHPNGWGIAGFDNGCVELYTEPVTACESENLSRLIKKHAVSENMIAHIRKATVGGMKPNNCHPFVMEDTSGRRWTLMHNGTIFSGTKLIPYLKKQQGDTDSERILLYLVARMDEETAKKGHPLNSFERFKVAEHVVESLSYRNKLNLIFFDGDQMYVHYNMRGTLFVKRDKDSTLFATVPLDEGEWTPMPLSTLIVYQNGKLKYRGKDHHNEYVDALGIYMQQVDFDIQNL